MFRTTRRFAAPGRALLGAAAAALVLTGPALGDEEGGSKLLTIGDEAPALDLTHWVKAGVVSDGDAFRPVTGFEDGKVYVVEFWATWCGPCRRNMPHLTELQQRFSDYDVAVIGVSDEPLPTIVDFLASPHPEQEGQLWHDVVQYALVTDPDRSAHDDYLKAAGERFIPTAFVVGKTGRIEWIGHPSEMDEPLERIVNDTWDREAARTAREPIVRARRLQQKAVQAMDEGEWDAAVQALDELLEREPSHAFALQQRPLALIRTDRHAEGYALIEDMVDTDWDNANVLNMVAWTIADDGAVKHRDLNLAMKAAKRANELTAGANASILDTLARVYYEQGDLTSAIEWQRKAVEHADGRMAPSLRETLEKYETEAKSTR